jgi:hypothetical protein
MRQMKISAIKIFIYATLILLFFITIDSFAQQKATLYGKLKDEYNKPVQGLRIFVLEQPENGIVSNENGTFELPIIAEVRQSIIFSAIGYKDTVILNLKPNQRYEFNKRINTSSVSLNTVNIEDKTLRENAGTVKIDAEKISNIPSSRRAGKRAGSRPNHPNVARASRWR